MGNSVLGLLFEISADPSKAKGALAQLESSTGTSFRNATTAIQPFNDSLLSNRESVRLLSEELGVHLPRAVSGAIAEIVPNIGLIGPALLGVFAVEEVVKWGKAAVDELHELQGETKELKKEWEGVIAEQEKLLRNPKTLTDALRDLDETNKRLSDQAKHINDLKAEQASLSPVLIGAIAGYASALSDAENEQAKLVERQIAQEDTKRKLLQQAEREGTTAAKVVLENYRQQAEQVKRLAEELNRFNQEEIKEGVAAEKRWAHLQAQDQRELEKALKETNKAVDQQGRGFVGMPAIFAPLNAGYQQLTAAQRAALPTLREEQLIYREITNLFPDMEQGEAKLKAQELARNATVRQLVENTKQHKVAQKELNEVIYESIAGGKLYGTILDQLRDASIKETDAVKQNTLASIQELSTGLAGLIAGRKGQAAVEAIWEGARGIACLAEGTWPPNPAAIMAAAKHFEAAAQYGILGGGGGGSQSSTTTTTTPAAMTASQLASLPGLPPGWTYNQYGIAVQMAGGLASPVSGNVTVMVVGDAGAANWISGVLNTGVQKNDVTLAATTSKRPTTVRR
jgi:hypothetical protein